MPGLPAAVRLISKCAFPHTVPNHIMNVFGQFLWGFLHLCKHAFA